MRILYVIFLLFLLSLGAQAGPLQKTFFGKEIDLDEWKTAMRMPLPELLLSVQRDVKVYSYRSGSETYPEADASIRQLPEAPKAYYNNYRRDIELSQAVGIYMPVDQLRHLINQPTLLLREDARHWTVVHEYTHHLFHQARAARNQNLPEGYLTPYSDHFETMQESYQKYEKNNFKFKNQAHLDEFIFCLKIATGFRIKMLLQFELEEIAIESMIRRYYRDQKNANFDQEYLENSVRYIQSNLKRVIKTLDGFIQLIDEASPFLKKGSGDELQLKTYRATMQTLKMQAQKFR